MNIPMSGPDLTSDELEAVSGVLRSSQLSLGPRLYEFERNFARFVGMRHAVGLSSGTAGLHVAIEAAGVREGDLVITTPFSFVASSNVILYNRAVPVFVDIEEATANIDPKLIVQAVKDLSSLDESASKWIPPSYREIWKKKRLPPKAILAVHAFGQSVDMDPIVEVARNHGICVIEDACEAIGSEYKGRQCGSLSDMGVFAFYANKQMTTGEGGMFVTNHSDIDALARSLRNQGRDGFDDWLVHHRLGYNYRMDELSAALGLVQLKRLEELLRKRARVAGFYEERLKEIGCIRLPSVASWTTCMSWFVYVIRLSSDINRQVIITELAERGIPTRLYFPPIHLQPFYVGKFGYSGGMFPVSEAWGQSTLALPFSGVMSEAQVDYVCEQLIAVLRGHGMLTPSASLKKSCSANKREESKDSPEPASVA